MEANGIMFVKVTINHMMHPPVGRAPTELYDRCETALYHLNRNERDEVYYDAVFQPFEASLKLQQSPLIVLALDCLSKLFEYNFWGPQTRDLTGNTEGLIGKIIESIAGCYSGDQTDEKIQTQVIKAMTAAVSSSDFESALHGSLLLKSIRVIYNIFLTSKSPEVQTVAQATLSQISTTVFNRINLSNTMDQIMIGHEEKLAKRDRGSKNSNSSLSLNRNQDGGEAFESSVALSELGNREPTTRESQEIMRDPVQTRNKNDQTTKDAYLIFRAFCKLSMKTLTGNESATDLKSQTMRSKLVSLVLVRSILLNHSSVFFYPSPSLFTSDVEIKKPIDIAFMIAVRQYLCLALTRNITSIVPQIFDLSMEIFGLMLVDLRSLLKKEISVIMVNIIVPMIQASIPVTYFQRVSTINILTRNLLKHGGGKLLVELYLNYDCDYSTGSEDNLWELLVKSLCQILASKRTAPVEPNNFQFNTMETLPLVTTTSLTNYTKEQVRQLYLAAGDSDELRNRVLNLLVNGVLSTLKDWMEERSAVVPEMKAAAEDGDDPTTFEMSRDKKTRLAEGIALFNQKPKSAITFLVKAKIIPSKTPRHVVHFLRNCPGLDKTPLGELLGEGDPDYVAIMHDYVDTFDFGKMDFVKALRTFLDNFRLPGEAQKIDRLMLKFAERYVNCNPNSFTSADTAYVLGYSVIMLNTDQHNPQVKKRMELAEFIRNNRGIDEGKSLPDEMLRQIFEEIRNNEIKLKDSNPDATAKEDSSSKPKKKKNNISSLGYGQPSLVSTIKQNNGATRDLSSLDSQFKPSEQIEFYEASSAGHIKHMFHIVWMSCLSALTSTLESSETTGSMILCLLGFRHCAYLCANNSLDLELKGYLSNLSKFIELGQLSDLQEITIEASKAMLEIALDNGESFREHWVPVVKCISQLERLQSAGLNVSGKPVEQRRMEKLYSEISSNAFTLTTDRIFSSSVKLSNDPMCSFAKALCDMSWDEIISSSSRINKGLDKLRQLATKFLELEELANFKFQQSFLKPFKFIFENNPDAKIKDMVLASVNHMVLFKAVKQKSGWKTIFSILAVAAGEKNESIVKLGFSITHTIHKDYLDFVLKRNAYGDLVETLTRYCQGTLYPKISSQAVSVLKDGAITVSLRTETPTKPLNTGDDLQESNDQLWLITLRNLQTVILTSDLEICSKALKDLFELLSETGQKYTNQFWVQIIDEIIVPLFNDLENVTGSEGREMWLSTALVSALKLFVQLYSQFPLLLKIAIDPILKLIFSCNLQENDTLSKLGSSCLEGFIADNIAHFDDEIWYRICVRVKETFKVTSPNELFFVVPDGTDKSQIPPGLELAQPPERSAFPKIIVKCVLHLNMIQTLHKILTCSKKEEIMRSMNQSLIFTFGDCLYRSYLFAQMFNRNLPIRKALLNIGFMKTLPNLVKQETSAAAAYFILLSRIYADQSRGLLIEDVEKRLIPSMYTFLQDFLTLDPATQGSSIKAMEPVVHSIVCGFTEFQDWQFQRNIPYFFDPLVNLVKSGNLQFAVHLAQIFSRIGKIYEIPKSFERVSVENMLFPTLQSLHTLNDNFDELATTLADTALREAILELGSN